MCSWSFSSAIKIELFDVSLEIEALCGTLGSGNNHFTKKICTFRFEPGGDEKYSPFSPTDMSVGLYMIWWGMMGKNASLALGMSGHRFKFVAR